MSFPLFLLYVRCKSGVTFVLRCLKWFKFLAAFTVLQVVIKKSVMFALKVLAATQVVEIKTSFKLNLFKLVKASLLW